MVFDKDIPRTTDKIFQRSVDEISWLGSLHYGYIQKNSYFKEIHTEYLEIKGHGSDYITHIHVHGERKKKREKKKANIAKC